MIVFPAVCSLILSKKLHNHAVHSFHSGFDAQPRLGSSTFVVFLVSKSMHINQKPSGIIETILASEFCSFGSNCDGGSIIDYFSENPGMIDIICNEEDVCCKLFHVLDSTVSLTFPFWLG